AERYAPQQGDKLLVSRLLDGTQVTLGAARVESGLQEKIRELEATGCEVILLLCTGEFGRLQVERVLLLEPDRIIPPLISAIVGTH
ncbi:AroM family protein, partial [Klebsiella aerogenes]|uniref:AroM family protein n=1 Tax=Klebsiella aerogenes TaxID=548 RepID=UPI001954708C